MEFKVNFLLLFSILIILIQLSVQAPPNRDKLGKKLKLHGLEKAKLKKASKYLRRYGYLGIDFDVEDVTEGKISKKLKVFQKYAKVKATGKLDAATIKRMSDPRCGMTDPLAKLEGKLTFRRSKRWTLQGQKWDFSKNPKNELTWKLENTARNVGFETVREIIRLALGKWSAVAMINFREVRSGDADLIVKFVRLQHDDQYAFDGRGGTLAHAFYPYPGYAISGDIHFDNDEDFTYKKNYGTDLLWVATHEAGHSLGLEHSNVQAAVMYPWYQGGLGDFNLRHDDIVGIQTLYGARPKTTAAPKTEKPTTQAPTTKEPTDPPTTEAPTDPPTTEAPTDPPTTEAPTDFPTTETPTDPPTTETPTEPPTTETHTEPPTTETPTEPPTTETPTEPPTTEKPRRRKYRKDCPPGISAGIIDPSTGWMIVFSGENFYLVARGGLRHGPIRVQSYFKDVSGAVTAAFVRKSDRHVIIFVGNVYYDYYNFQLMSGPRPVSDFGLPSSANIDAAFYWKGNGRLYMFTGTQYYRLNRYSTDIDRYYPRTISKAWRGLPSRVTTAMTSYRKRGKSGETIFVSNDKFYIFHDRKIRIKPGYPKHIKSWLRCHSNVEHPRLYPGAIGAIERYSEPVDP
eukprot:gene6072-6774_t